jgi:glycosyltransferase involved in cell wall biosynthesis
VAAQTILFCSHAVDWGGAETVLVDLLAELDRRRFEPHLAVPGPGALPDRARQLGVTVHEVPFGGRSPLQKALHVPGAARALRRLAGRLGTRLLYANTMIAGYAGVLAQTRDLRCLWHLHVVTRSRIARLALRRAAGVVAPSQAGADAVDPTLAARGRLHVVPNGVAPAFFGPAGTGLRDALGLPPGTPLLGCFGRLDPHKGIDVLLRALAAVPAAAAHVIVVGGESFAAQQARVRGHGEALRRLAAELGLAPRVHFLGHRDDVAALVGQCDLVVVPSRALESAPRAIAEAQAAGRVVIASRIGGVPELIDDGCTGLLVPPAEPAPLAAAITRVLAEPDLRARLGRAARDRAERDYALPAFVRRIEAVCAATIAAT